LIRERRDRAGEEKIRKILSTTSVDTRCVGQHPERLLAAAVPT